MYFVNLWAHPRKVFFCFLYINFFIFFNFFLGREKRGKTSSGGANELRKDRKNEGRALLTSSPPKERDSLCKMTGRKVRPCHLQGKANLQLRYRWW